MYFRPFVIAALSLFCSISQAQTTPAVNFSPSFVDSETPQGVVDGSNLTFSLSTAPTPASSLMLYRNGILLKAGADYSLLNTTIQFVSASAPQPSDIVSAVFRAGSTNVALGKAASQSSTASTASAALALDGNTDGVLSDGSVTQTTGVEANPWWQVDLGSSADVRSVVLWNRTDCCSGRLNDYWIFISDTPFGSSDTPATLQTRAGTWSNHQTSAPTPYTTILTGVTRGRYLRVQLSGTAPLSLAEVQVIGSFPRATLNLSLGNPASQSSTYAGTPALAVDGNTDGNFMDGSVTHTNNEASPWWQVDLGSSATLSSVVVWNRTDCCGDRLSDYWVFLSDTPFGPSDTPTTLQNRVGTWSNHQSTAPAPSTTIQVGGAQGRYLRVQLTGTNALSIAEVQAFGSYR